MDQVYIVFFTTGEFEDRIDEVSKLFYSRTEAENYSDRMNSDLIQNRMHESNVGNIADYESRHSRETLIKYGSYVDYTGANFYVSGPFQIGE